ncbi:MAG: hypothetical protein OZ923_11510 [Comamonadaceae bacterium]|nr:hypothetical protein [Burkholderiales bacterium]MEB2349222.1 hypothetical protein [Comamonadaceae bacterium]
MTPVALIQTTILMGLLVLCGGAWSALYCLGKARERPDLLHIGIACYVVALGLALAISLYSPLTAGWKLLIVVSALAYAVIPPITLRYLEQLHEGEEA